MGERDGESERQRESEGAKVSRMRYCGLHDWAVQENPGRPSAVTVSVI